MLSKREELTNVYICFGRGLRILVKKKVLTILYGLKPVKKGFQIESTHFFVVEHALVRFLA